MHSGTLLRKFIYGLGIDEVVCMIDVADDNEIYYYHYDGLGSVIAISEDNGQVVERYKYTAFGGVTILNPSDESRETSDVNNPYMFTGRRYDAETGNYYYRARYYHPTIGRFMSPDPLGLEAGLNLYRYVTNSPLNWIDPFGLSEYWKWSKWDVITFFPHAFFDMGVGINKGAVGGYRAVTGALKLREKRIGAMERVIEGGKPPQTMGPSKDYNKWAKDAAKAATTVPGTSATGPAATTPGQVAASAATGAAAGAALEAVEDSGDSEKDICETETESEE